MSVKLLGVPRHLQADGELRLPPEHPLLLLTYLNAHEVWISRQEILKLFYTGEEEGVARNKLRQLLFRAKKQSWFDGLETRPQHLKHSAQTDLKHFREAVEKGSWADAVAAYGGPLLRDTPVTDLPAYEAWLDDERQDIDGSFEDAAFWHAKDLEEWEQHNVACQTLSKLLVKDPLNEEAMQAYLRNALHGEPARALELYGRFKASLAKDLGMEPLGETVELAKKLGGLAAASSPESAQEPTGMPPTQTLQNQPGSLTPFVGRELERSYMLGLLEGGSRLVTLMGLGGIGKTRLALATAAEYSKSLEHAGVFVPLASVASANLIPGAVLGALGLEPNAQQNPTEQVTDYLKDKELLLVLDNFEHLIASEFVQTLLTATLNVRVLVTSRERLNLSQEQVFELTGMALPPNLGEGGGLETFDAVKLFLKSARRNDPTFTLEPGNRQAIFDLCRTLQGVPLALELAASWLRLMRVDEILSEAEQSFDLLESDFGDLPARHQSLRAVFESSWRLLSANEQTTLTPLAIFAGGFSLEAAKAVTGAKPRILLRLVNKSLLRREQTGRFVFLEVVRQYAREKLEQDADLYSKTAQAHADYYRNLSKTAAPKVKGGPEQLEQLNLLEAEHVNLRLGLEHYLEHRDAASALEFANNLFDYWFIRGHWNEARRYQERILTLSSDPTLERQRAEMIAHTGYIATVQGHYQTATDLLETSIESLKKQGDDAGLRFALLCMGVNAHYQGDYTKAAHYHRESLSLARKAASFLEEASALHELANATLRLGDLEKAKQFFTEALELRTEHQDFRNAAMTLTSLGIIARRQGDYGAAESFYEKSLGLSRKVKDRLATANALNSLGVLVKLQGRYEDAKDAYDESLKLLEESGDSFGVGMILENMGILSRLQKDYASAKTYLLACLENRRSRADRWGTAKALNGLGIVSYQQGEIHDAVTYLQEGFALANELKEPSLIAQNLIFFSFALSVTPQQEMATVFLAKGSEILGEKGIVLVPIEKEEAEHVKRVLETNLAPDVFKKQWHYGQALAPDAVAAAVEKIQPELLGDRAVQK